MAIFTGSRGGVLRGVKTLIPRNSLVRKVVVDTVTQLGGIKKYIVNESTDADCKTIPYDLEFGSGITVYEILDKIKGIYPRWEMFFDEEVFVYQEFSTSTNDSVVLDNTIMGELVISENTKSSFTDIKNCIEIFGLNDLNGRVKLYNKMPSVIEENVNYIIDPLSPFSVEKIGEVWSVFSGGEYEKIYTQKLILDRCTYELWLATAMKESIGLTTIFIPFLKVNDKISYKKKFNNESSDYLVQRISFDLTSGISDIELVKFTPLYSWL